MHRQEIDKLSMTLHEKGQALVPLQLYFSDGRAKVELGVGKGKREYDKRHSLKERQDRRETDRAVQAHKHR
jgi:SsrA-binding protein